MTKEQLIDIKKYLEDYKCLKNGFKDYSKMYSMTTENIYGFLNNYDLKNKSVLSVAGSGDQRLNSYLLGAKDVTCFDVNPITELHLKLKDEAIKHIDYHEFVYFFDIYSNPYNKEYSSLDPRIFRKFKKYLDEDTYSLYNYIINESIYLRCSDIYIDFDNELSILNKMNNYLEYDSYYNLRKIIKDKKVDFIHCEAEELPEILDNKKYDFILLSNISDYVHKFYSDDNLVEYRNLIEKLKNNLNENGIMQVGYIYSYYNRGEDISDFHFNDERHKYFPIDEFNSMFVDSYHGDGSYDKVIIYKKKI